MSEVRRTRRLALGIAGAVTGLIAAAAALPQPGATAMEEDPVWFGGRLLVLRDGDGNHQQLWDPGTLERTPWRWQDGFGIGVFSHDGALFASRSGQRSAELRHPDGTVESLGRIPARQPELSDDDLTFDIQLLSLGFVDASPTVLAVSAADGTGEHYHQHPYLWRLEPGEEPTRVAYLGDFVDSRTTVVSEPRSPYAYFAEPGGGLGRVDVTTAAVEHLSDADLTPLVIEPTSDRVLVHDPAAARLAWYDVSDDSLTTWLDPGDDSSLEFLEAWLTPDGAAVMLHDPLGTGVLEIRATADAALLHSVQLSWDAPGPASVFGWQPCPGGTCPVFVPDEPPPPVPDFVARSGRPGAPSTVRLDWTKLPDLLGGVTQYVVRVVRWRDGERVATETLSYDRWIGRAAPPLVRGDYTAQVRARNNVGYGPWSDPSDVVRAR